VRVGRIFNDDDTVTHVINPTVTQLEYSDVDLVLSGHKDGLNMIEVGAAEIPDDELIECIKFGEKHIHEHARADR
jgi:polyribonucleotide nucleotidyltransferase